MKKNRITLKSLVWLAPVLSFMIVSWAYAGKTVDNSKKNNSDSYETADGVLTIKEGHGDFLIRQSDGKAQRFSVKGDAAITRNGKPVKYGALKVKDNVRVDYDPSTRKVIAIKANGP